MLENQTKSNIGEKTTDTQINIFDEKRPINKLKCFNYLDSLKAEPFTDASYDREKIEFWWKSKKPIPREEAVNILKDPYWRIAEEPKLEKLKISIFCFLPERIIFGIKKGIELHNLRDKRPLISRKILTEKVNPITQIDLNIERKGEQLYISYLLNSKFRNELLNEQEKKGVDEQLNNPILLPVGNTVFSENFAKLVKKNIWIKSKEFIEEEETKLQKDWKVAKKLYIAATSITKKQTNVFKSVLSLKIMQDDQE